MSILDEISNLKSKGASIDKLKYNFDTGARANRFDAYFLLPSSFASPAARATESMSIRLESCQLPGRDLKVKAFSEHGAVRQMPTGDIDSGGTMDFTFLCDQHFADRLVLEAWQQTIFSAGDGDDSGTEINPKMSWYDDYIGTIEIFQRRMDDKNALKFTLHEAYPVKIAAQELSKGAKTEVMKFTCTIAYRNWESEYVPAPERSALNKGRVILDALLGGAKVLGRFGKADKFRKKLSNLDTRATQINNLFGDGG